MVIVKFIKTSGNEDINIPKYQTSGSVAVDLHAAVKGEIIIKPGERKLISSGICIELPEGFVGEITPRSGLALKYGISIVNSPGIIDSDYRGEIGVILINQGREDFIVKRNERIAQMNIKRFEKVEFLEEKNLSNSSRGIGSFGSTGKK